MVLPEAASVVFVVLTQWPLLLEPSSVKIKDKSKVKSTKGSVGVEHRPSLALGCAPLIGPWSPGPAPPAGPDAASATALHSAHPP